MINMSIASKKINSQTVIIASTVFNQVIALASLACNSSVHPVLASVLIDFDGNDLIITAQDTNTYFVGKVSLNSAHKSDKFQVLIPNGVLARVASRLAGIGELQIGLFDEQLMISSVSGHINNFSCKLASLYDGYGKPQSYPSPDVITKEECCFAVDVEKFIGCLEYASASSSKDLTRGMFNGVKLEINSSGARFVATNGIHTSFAAYTDSFSHNLSVVLPLDFIKLAIASTKRATSLNLIYGKNQYDQDVIEFSSVSSDLACSIGTRTTSAMAFPPLETIREECKPNSLKFPRFLEVKLSEICSALSRLLVNGKESRLFLVRGDQTVIQDEKLPRQDEKLLRIAVYGGEPDSSSSQFSLSGIFLDCLSVDLPNDLYSCVAAPPVLAAVSLMQKREGGNGKLRIYFGKTLICFVCENHWFAIARIIFTGVVVFPEIPNPSTNIPVISSEPAVVVEPAAKPDGTDIPENADVVDDIATVGGAKKKTAKKSKSIPAQTPTIVEVAAPPSIYEVYKVLKLQHSKHLLMIRSEANYEAYDEDAEAISDSIGLLLNSKKIAVNQRARSIGFPAHALSLHVGALLESGFSCAIASEENGEMVVAVEEPVDDF